MAKIWKDPARVNHDESQSIRRQTRREEGRELLNLVVVEPSPRERRRRILHPTSQFMILLLET
jgi:hypothetical protein